MRRAYLRADLARDLGLHPSSITKWAKRGMPTHSAEAARAWRRANVEAAWMKRPAPVAAAAPDTLDERLLALVARLANLCAAGDPAPWLEQLRGAMAELPPRLWSRVELDVATWDALCGTVLRQMEADDPGDPDAVLTADDEARADVVMYALAAGLAVYNPPAADA